ncbi:hypothetical protein A3Q56_01827 [Intoshia linei]|uniref:Uncharacterized protein n=1 Tax=Intoshia linei TaxID=1819745 RepID=A0A177B823_9BILA|nr:hypothetical protein A3Q56_01827 [Intoshia linei]
MFIAGVLSMEFNVKIDNQKKIGIEVDDSDQNGQVKLPRTTDVGGNLILIAFIMSNKNLIFLFDIMGIRLYFQIGTDKKLSWSILSIFENLERNLQASIDIFYVTLKVLTMLNKTNIDDVLKSIESEIPSIELDDSDVELKDEDLNFGRFDIPDSLKLRGIDNISEGELNKTISYFDGIPIKPKRKINFNSFKEKMLLDSKQKNSLFMEKLLKEPVCVAEIKKKSPKVKLSKKNLKMPERYSRFNKDDEKLSDLDESEVLNDWTSKRKNIKNNVIN